MNEGERGKQGECYGNTETKTSPSSLSGLSIFHCTILVCLMSSVFLFFASSVVTKHF